MFMLLHTLIIFMCTSKTILMASALNDEGQALLSIKQSITGDPYAALLNWNSSDETPCNWNGIACNIQNAVISITLPMRHLSGSLSPSLGSLSQLVRLNLRMNTFDGPLPAEICKLWNLRILVLSYNYFSGSLPFEFGNLLHLETLDLAKNSVAGPIPPSLLQCKILKNLVLSHNNFTGPLPLGFWRSFLVLRTLDLSFNNFSGDIPDDLSYMANLRQRLDLSHNGFTGLIPSSLGRVSERVYIDLSYNNFTGPIPEERTLIIRGPTAFIGNPGLCGPPLKTYCPLNRSEYSPSPAPSPGQKTHRRVSVNIPHLMYLLVMDLIVFGLVMLILWGCFSCACCNANKTDDHECRDCACFDWDEHGSLVALDSQVNFDLGELLKASAFVLSNRGFGIVYKAVFEDGRTVAVRRLGEGGGGGSRRFREFRAEVEGMAQVKHPNILTLKAYYWSSHEKLLIYDFMPNGNLASAIHGKPGVVNFTPLSWRRRLQIMKGVARGLAYLHEYSSRQYVHGDLKPSNILLGDDMEPKIADFGLKWLVNIANRSVFGQEVPTLASELSAPPSPGRSALCYQAPEALICTKPTRKGDVYSYGVILLEMMRGRSAARQYGGNSSETHIVRWAQLSIDDKKPVREVLDPYLLGETDQIEEIMGVLKIATACTRNSPQRRPPMRLVCDGLDAIFP